MTTRALLFDRDREEQHVELDPKLVRSLNRNRLLWVDIDDPAGGAIASTARLLEIPREVLPRRTADVEPTITIQPSLARAKGWIRLTIVGPEPPDDEPVATPNGVTVIDILAGSNVVVTVHDGPAGAVEHLEHQLRGETGLGILDAAALLAALVDEVLSLYLRHVEAIERRIDVLDELAIRGRSASRYLGEVVALRRRIAGLRRALAPHREAFGPLARPDFEIAALGRPWPGLVDRLEVTILAIESVRELLIGSVALQQSSTAERVNDVMKRLTLLNAVLLPSVVLAGVMGMNFKIGFFEQPSNFLLVIGAMALLAIGALGWARFRGWL